MRRAYMTTRELIAHLQHLDPQGTMPVVCSRYSDVQVFGKDEVTHARVLWSAPALPDGGPVKHNWMIKLSPRDEETMDPKLRGRVKDVVHFDGN